MRPAPLARIRGLTGLGRFAVDNALQSLEEIQRVVRDREHLVAALVHRPGPVAAETLTELDEQRCWELLKSQHVGRFGYVARVGQPEVAPVNYVLDGRSVVFRSGPGPKLQAAERKDTVVFEVDLIDPATRSGWSVVVHGRARVLAPTYPLRHEPEPWAAGPRRHLVQVVPKRVTGRVLAGTGA